MTLLHELHTSLARRLQPEHIAHLISQGMGDQLSPSELKVLDKATRRASWASSMPTDFWKPADMKRQTSVAVALIPAVAAPKFDACALITKEEIEAIEGSPITDVKSSENSDGEFRVSQCFYTAK